MAGPSTAPAALADLPEGLPPKITPRAQTPGGSPSAPTAPDTFSALAASSVLSLKGVGEKVAESLNRLGISTLGDLLTHYPRRYEDRAQFAKIANLRDGETATILGTVTAVENRPTKTRLVITRITVDDGSKAVATLTYFNQWRMKQTFQRLLGKQLVAYGVVKRGFATIEMAQPEYEALDDASDATLDSLSMGRIVPIYDLTEGIGQKLLRKLVFAAATRVLESVDDLLPPELCDVRRLMPASEALRAIHFPESQMQLESARRRFVYEELFVMQLLLAGRRNAAQKTRGISFGKTSPAVAEFEAVLPFQLTGAQSRAINEIAEDMRAVMPMNRLVQGDVGSGKTAVAMAAMVIAARNGYQTALMAPTEILAEQHLRVVRSRLEDLGIRVDLLTGSRPAREKNAVRDRIQSGDTGVVVGTHALIQEGVNFHRLGLAIIDEQHRFGVLQRAALVGKGSSPDVLVMTATPIPRTLTLTVYGDLDVSIIDELPPGRKPIRTHARSGLDKASVYEGVRKLLREGRQAFVVCSLIEESEKLQARAASELAIYLAEHVFPEYSVGLLHGQMSTSEKDGVMAQVCDGAIQVLVATTVIEVGVDVPNAAVMVIEDADRFGLAQLHQLRGRVGRGEHPSFCVLIADPKSEAGHARLNILCETTDGFRIAEEDLRLRGPGEFYGVRQSGLPGLKIADIVRDVGILHEAREDAFRVLANDPNLTLPSNQTLREMVRQSRWEADPKIMVDVA